MKRKFTEYEKLYFSTLVLGTALLAYNGIDSLKRYNFESKYENEIVYDNENIEEIIKNSLEKYENEKSTLQKQIDELKKEKEELTYNTSLQLDDLILGEVESDETKELYIFIQNADFTYEYHNDFYAVINAHDESVSHNEYCAGKYHLKQEDTSPLALSLTYEELEEIHKCGDRITTSKLDSILERLRREYFLKNNNNNKKLEFNLNKNTSIL